MSTFFKVSQTQKEQWQGNIDFSAEFKELNEQDPEIIIANYAERLLNKFKRLAHSQEPLAFEDQ
jgi:hypothetical protein